MLCVAAWLWPGAFLHAMQGAAGADPGFAQWAAWPTTGTARAVALADDRLFAAEGAAGLAAYDIANPRQPAPIGRAAYPAPLRDLAAARGMLYAAAGAQGVAVYDAPPNGPPVFAGAASAPGFVERLSAAGLWMAAGLAYEGAAIYSLVDPRRPRLLARTSTPDRVYSVAASGWRLLAAEGEAGAAIYDLARPDDPDLLWRVDTGAAALDAQWTGEGFAVALGAAGWRRYALGPSGPEWLEEHPEPAFCLAYSDGRLFLGGADASVRVLDSSGEWALAGRLALPGAPLSIAAGPEAAAAAMGRDGLALFRSGKKMAVREIGRHQGFLRYARSVETEGGQAVVSDAEAGVALFDVADPANPLLRWRLASGFLPAEARFIDSRTIVASDPERGLATLRWNPPFVLEAARLAARSGSPRGFRLLPDGTALASAMDYGIQLAAMAPGQGVSLGLSPLDFVFALDVDYLGDTAYVASEGTGLAIYDIANRAMPEHIGDLALGGARRIRIDRAAARAYVAAGAEGAYIVDLSDPRAPAVLGRCPLWDARAVEPAGRRYALAAEGPHGLAILDLADPARPALLQRIRFAPEEICEDVDVRGALAYLAHGRAGLIVLSVEGLLDGEARSLDWTPYR